MKTFVWVEMDLKEKGTSNIETVYISDRESVGKLQSGNAVEFVWPILQTVRGFGSGMDNYLPSVNSGSIVLETQHDSLGYERRFLDLLDRYTIQFQKCAVKIKVFEEEENFTIPDTPDYELELTMRSWVYSPAGGTLTIAVNGRQLDNRIVTYTIERNILLESGISISANETTVGRTLPLFFGKDVELATYNVILNDFFYGIQRSFYSYDSDFKPFFRTPDDGYREVVSKVNTDLLSRPFESGKSSADLAVNVEQTIFPCRFNEPALISQMGIHIDQTISGAVSGDPNQINLQFALGDGEFFPDGFGANSVGMRAPQTILANGFVDCEFTVPATEMIVAFERPIFVEPGQLYWIIWNSKEDRQKSTSWTRQHYLELSVDNGFGDVWLFLRSTIDPSIAFWASLQDGVGSHLKFYYSCYGVQITDGTTASLIAGKGFSPRRIRCTNPPMNTVNGTRSVGGVVTRYDSEAFTVRRDGILDTGSGAITGTPNALIEKPEHVARFLSSRFDGSSWSAPAISTSKFSQASGSPSAYSYRVVSGQTRGRTSFQQALNEVCRSTQCRVLLTSEGFQFFAEGLPQTRVRRIEENQCRVLSIGESGGDRTIINDVELFLQLRIIAADVVQGTAEGEFQSYAIDAAYRDASSVQTYGERDIFRQTMNMLGDQISGNRVARILVDKWSEPSVQVQLALPLVAFPGVDLGDTVHISHPELHAFFGTSYDATGPSFDGEIVDQGGMPERRAKLWRGIIETRDIDTTQRQGPELIITVRLYASTDNCRYG